MNYIKNALVLWVSFFLLSLINIFLFKKEILNAFASQGLDLSILIVMMGIITFLLGFVVALGLVYSRGIKKTLQKKYKNQSIPENLSPLSYKKSY